MFYITGIYSKQNTVGVFDTDDYTEQFIKFAELYELLYTYPEKFTDTLNNKREVMRLKQYGITTTVSNYLKFGKYVVLRTKRNRDMHVFLLYYNHKLVKQIDYCNNTAFIDMGNEVWIIYDNQKHYHKYFIWRESNIFDLDKVIFPYKLSPQEIDNYASGNYLDFKDIDVIRPWEERYTMIKIEESSTKAESNLIDKQRCYHFTFRDNYTGKSLTLKDFNLTIDEETHGKYETLLKVKAPMYYTKVKRKIAQITPTIQVKSGYIWIDDHNVISATFSSMNQQRLFNTMLSKYLTWSAEKEIYDLEQQLGCMELHIDAHMNMYNENAVWQLKYITRANYFCTYRFGDVALQGDILIRGDKFQILGEEKKKEIMELLKDAGLVK